MWSVDYLPEMLVEEMVLLLLEIPSLPSVVEDDKEVSAWAIRVIVRSRHVQVTWSTEKWLFYKEEDLMVLLVQEFSKFNNDA